MSAVAFEFLIVATFFLCTTAPMQSERSGYWVSLTLDDNKNTRAIFSGKPINAFLTFNDSVTFNDIAWHLGYGKIIRPSVAASKKMKTLQVQLYWETMPVKKDTLGNYFDSIYVSMGGERFRSNNALVVVTNIAPVIDSIKISKRVYSRVAPSSDSMKYASRFHLKDTIFDTVKAYDSFPTFSIRVFAHDINSNSPWCEWWGSGLQHSTVNNFTITYLLPRSNHTDTIGITVRDGFGGNCDKIIFLTSTNYKNRAPVLDSVRVKDSVFAGLFSPVLYTAPFFDSLIFRAYARDSDAIDNLHALWTDKNPKLAVLRQKDMTMTWACTSATCKDTAQPGKVNVMDTVTVLVYDNDSAVVKKSIVIVKGAVVSNKQPSFDSLWINDSCAKGTGDFYRCTATGTDTLRFGFFYHDPDSADTVHVSIKAAYSINIQTLSDTSIRYSCNDSIYFDTVTVMLFDKHKSSVEKRIIVDVNNRYPRIDSLRCDDSLFQSASAFYSYPALGLDTVVFSIFGYDPDSGDILTDTVLASGAVPVNRIGTMRYQYVCDDSTYSDTLTCVLVDSSLKASIKKVVFDITKR